LFPKKKLAPPKTGSALIVLYRCGLVGGRVCILGDKSKIDARKEDRGSRKKKRGAILSGSNEGRLRDTIDGAENDRGNYSLESRIIEEYSNDDDVARESSEGCREVKNGFG
jgi:hypothetical protein